MCGTSLSLRSRGRAYRFLETQAHPRRALSLTEVIVVIAVASILAALVLPAIQGARQSAHRAKCASNLRQIGIAILNYESAHRIFPPGSIGKNFSFLAQMLPFLDQQPLFDAINFDEHAERGNPVVRGTRVTVYTCPSDPSAGNSFGSGQVIGSNYAGNNYGSSQ